MKATFDFDKELVAARPGLRRFAIRYANKRFDADDLVSETMIKALAARDQFQPGTNFKAWLCMILRNFALTHYRRIQRETELPDESLSAMKLTDPSASAETRAQLAEALLAFDKLAITDDNGKRFDAVKTLELYVFHEATYEEVAEYFDVPLGTAKSRISRARKALREAMKLPEDC